MAALVLELMPSTCRRLFFFGVPLGELIARSYLYLYAVVSARTKLNGVMNVVFWDLL